MNISGYKPKQFGKYEVTVTGAVYTRGPKGELKRVKGAEAIAVLKGLSDAMLTEENAIRSEIAKMSGGAK